MLRILTLTTLYPNKAQQNHGVFVENRLRHLKEAHDVDIHVIAPVPFFPFKNNIFGKYAEFANCPKIEQRHGITIDHPRYFIPPKVGMTYAAKSLERCFLKAIEKLEADGREFDLIDAHYFYPDGVAAAQLADKLNKPLLITARGTDISLIPNYPKQREMILEATAIADHSITVCEALKQEMIKLGARGDKITTLRNGVDLNLFSPLERNGIRDDLSLSGTVFCSVGHLIDRKGHDLAIELTAKTPNATLLIAGKGPEEKFLKQLAEELDVADRVRFLGAIPHAELPKIYNAADVLILGSSREGWPNVLLEAMACGTPCVAADIWGVGEVITAPESGRLAKERNIASLKKAMDELLDDLPEREATRRYAEGFSWEQTSNGQYELMQTAVNQHKSVNKQIQWQKGANIKINSSAPQLLVTVDTEEAFDWNSSKFNEHTIPDVSDIDLFQTVCAQNNAKPLYFITWPLLNDPASATYYKNLFDKKIASCGIHLHQWVTPPLQKENSPYTSYQCNLEPELHTQKLSQLCQRFSSVFGVSPIAHRAGRYGVSPMVHQHLGEQGVVIDFSPSSAFDNSADGGPDFTPLSNSPWYRIGQNGSHSLACFPVTGKRFLKKINLPVTEKLFDHNFSTKNKIARKLTAPMRLTPEGTSLEEMKALTKAVVKDGTDVLFFSLHSSTLSVGGTPYIKSTEERDAFLAKIDSYLKWFTKEIGELTSLEELADQLNLPT